MKTTYNWLKEYVDLQAEPGEIAERLTMLGLEVESLEHVRPRFKDVVAGRVLEVEPLPESDHLVVAKVDAGERHGVLTVVSGAPNVRSGTLAAVAPPGAKLANGKEISVRRFGAVESVGMLCSEAELGLTSRADRIWVLDEETLVSPGQDLSRYVGEDWVFEINVTPNRPDCLGTIGIARELAAAYHLPLRPPTFELREKEEDVGQHVSVEIVAPEACPRYTARYLWDVSIGPSPFWMAYRLELAGMRAINNVVDVTNYVMLEYGQPLHAFDYDLLDEGTIVVRFAQEGDEFITLDGKLHRLFSDTLMICDKNKPVAIAGVMGGENSEVSEATTRVLLESAYFAPENIRRTRRKLGISTESSYRFERGVDPNGVADASDRAAFLMAQTAGAKVARGIVDVYPKPLRPWRVALRPRRVNQVLGTQIPGSTIQGILEGLGLAIEQQEDSLSVTVPTFRPDLTREIDLIEEIARHYGYDEIGAETVAAIDQRLAGRGRDLALERARTVLVGLGLFEAVNLSLIPKSHAEPFVDDTSKLARVVNPLGEELAWLRPSLLPGLLASTVRNLNRRQQRVFLFEWGKVFRREDKANYSERLNLAGTISGLFSFKTWRTDQRPVDFYDLKGIVNEFVRAIGGKGPIEFQSAAFGWAQEGGFRVVVGEKPVGSAGRVAQKVLEVFECEHDVYAFEFDWEQLKAVLEESPAFQAIPKFPPVEQDLALLADERIQAGTVEQVIRENGGPYLRQVRLFDLYRGEQIPAGKKSLAYSLVFQADDRTLTEEEVRDQVERILEALSRELGVSLRPR